jgi:hypothetical protein
MEGLLLDVSILLEISANVHPLAQSMSLMEFSVTYMRWSCVTLDLQM